MDSKRRITEIVGDIFSKVDSCKNSANGTLYRLREVQPTVGEYTDEPRHDALGPLLLQLEGEVERLAILLDNIGGEL